MATIKRGPAKPRTFEILWPGGVATTSSYEEAIVVFNALSRAFTRVVVLDQDSKVLLTYNNR